MVSLVPHCTLFLSVRVMVKSFPRRTRVELALAVATMSRLVGQSALACVRVCGGEGGRGGGWGGCGGVSDAVGSMGGLAWAGNGPRVRALVWDEAAVPSPWTEGGEAAMQEEDEAVDEEHGWTEAQLHVPCSAMRPAGRSSTGARP